MNDPRLHILLVEDDEDDYLITRNFLKQIKRARFQLEWVDSYEEALSALLRQQHDVYLIDFRLGQHTGLELVREAQERGFTAPLIVLTGHGEQDTDIEAMRAGAADYLVKGQIGPLVLERSIRYAVAQRQMLMELRKSSERYQLVTETATDAIITIDENGHITFANRAAELIFGYGHDELISQPITLLVPDAPPHTLADFQIANMIGTADIIADTIELSGTHKSGKSIPLDISLGASIEQGQRVYTVILRDVTHRKQLEQQLVHAQKMEAVGRLAGGIAHDFNNLLTAIIGYGEFLLADFTTHDPRRGDAEAIVKSAQRGAGLTRQLLAFSRKQMLRPEVLGLNDIVRQMDSLLRRLIGEHIALASVAAHGLGAIKVDPSQIEQVIMNLAVNARDAMPHGGVLTIETANVTLGAHDAHWQSDLHHGEYVMLAVSDTGTGMSAEIISHIFEPFFTTKDPGEGTGLGLSTVYGIVKQSGGDIRVESEPGRGTTFKLYFPRIELAAPTALVPNIQPEPRRGSETILLVEDEPPVRQMLRRSLEHLGYTVLEARDGADALRIVAQHNGPLDLLLTDVVMPGLSGIELAHHLAGLRPSLRVLYMSGYADGAIKHQGIPQNQIEFIQKPFTTQLLAQWVRASLDGGAHRSLSSG